MAMLMHSITDFNMHNGADGLYFFFCCGLLIAATNIRFVYPESQTLLQKYPPASAQYFLAATAIFAVTTIIIQLGNVRAQNFFNKTSSIYISKRLKPEILSTVKSDIGRAIHNSPLNYRYSYKLGSLENYFGNDEKGRQYLIRSAMQNPMYGSTLQSIGLTIEDSEQSSMLLEKGYQRGLDDNELALTYMDYLLKTENTQQALEVMASKLRKYPALLPALSSLFSAYSLSVEEISQVLGTPIDNWISYASLLESAGNIDQAGYYFESALIKISNAEELKPQWFQKLMLHYKKSDQPDKSLAILRHAVESIPDNISFHLQLGDYYRKEGINFRAKEEYERVLLLQPGNRGAMKRLRKMGLMDSY